MRRRTVEADFTKDRQEVALEPLQATPAPSTPSETTVIGTGAKVDGNLVSAASLRIEGSVKGNITAEGDVIVAADADVVADIRAANVSISGKYKGNVNCTGTLEMSGTARVEGNVTCGALIVSNGAVFTGQSTMGGKGTAEASKPKIEEPPSPENGSKKPGQ